VTNDVLVANPHQVVDNPSHNDVIPERYSIAFFCNMNKDVTLEPLKGLNDEPMKYAPINAHDYITGRLSSTIGSE
jgi:isopenicillin N synthase-like dioxygenase